MGGPSAVAADDKWGDKGRGGVAAAGGASAAGPGSVLGGDGMVKSVAAAAGAAAASVAAASKKNAGGVGKGADAKGGASRGVAVSRAGSKGGVGAPEPSGTSPSLLDGSVSVFGEGSLPMGMPPMPLSNDPGQYALTPRSEKAYHRLNQEFELLSANLVALAEQSPSSLFASSFSSPKVGLTPLASAGLGASGRNALVVPCLPKPTAPGSLEGKGKLPAAADNALSPNQVPTPGTSQAGADSELSGGQASSAQPASSGRKRDLKGNLSILIPENQAKPINQVVNDAGKSAAGGVQAANKGQRSARSGRGGGAGAGAGGVASSSGAAGVKKEEEGAEAGGAGERAEGEGARGGQDASGMAPNGKMAGTKGGEGAPPTGLMRPPVAPSPGVGMGEMCPDGGQPTSKSMADFPLPSPSGYLQALEMPTPSADLTALMMSARTLGQALAELPTPAGLSLETPLGGLTTPFLAMDWMSPSKSARGFGGGLPSATGLTPILSSATGLTPILSSAPPIPEVPESAMLAAAASADAKQQPAGGDHASQERITPADKRRKVS
eukprot:jgi/Mesvir1/30/Mv19460-RA.2